MSGKVKIKLNNQVVCSKCLKESGYCSKTATALGAKPNEETKSQHKKAYRARYVLQFQKNGQVRVCIHFIILNKSVKTEYDPLLIL